MSLASAPVARVALIGISGYAHIYLDLVRAFQARGELKLICVVIINASDVPETVQEIRGWGTTIYDSFEQMFAREAGKIDLCLVPTGIPWHARMTIAALTAGMNVLVEKPLAGSLLDAAAIRAAERRAGRFVAVGFQDLYVPELLWLKQQLVGGRIGRLRSIRFVGLWPRPCSYFERNRWAGRLQAEGAETNDSPLNNAFAHFVNISLFLASPELKSSGWPVVERAQLYRAHAIESFDTAVVCGHTKDGVSLWFGASHASEVIREPEIIVDGTGGQAEWRHERQCKVVPIAGPGETRAVPDYAHSREAMFTAVLSRLRDPAVFICGTAIAECHTALVDGLSAGCTIKTFDADAVRAITPSAGGSAVPAVAGLESAMDRAFRTGGTLEGVAPIAAGHIAQTA